MSGNSKPTFPWALLHSTISHTLTDCTEPIPTTVYLQKSSELSELESFLYLLPKEVSQRIERLLDDLRNVVNGSCNLYIVLEKAKDPIGRDIGTSEALEEWIDGSKVDAEYEG